MPPSKLINVKLTAEQLAALDAFCVGEGRERSEVIRTATFAAIGQPALAATMPSAGRPKGETTPPPAKPARKAARRRK